ncbi:N-acetylmuramoyl-L-alanine amidase [Mycobacteroides chelonae]|uniref:N-acetylmuramoyl-L-alanine amidase n=1 Tax=Mycobacteroides chelonae TaxID=1774 RepID=UPI0008A9D2B0|nr:N-acetylmuramoyl-L-alanine amidase [Mycobacteroides chelonae]OHU48096.1 N-acetylmuramoyl-L-alanine amidase [Mycobacteroides chelonae]
MNPTTEDQVAQIIVAEAKARGYTRAECLAVKSTLYQESEWDEGVWDPTHTTYGVAQQDASYIHRFEGAAAQVKAFFDKLDIWRRKPGASSDIWLNIAWMQQRPNWESAQYWYDHGRRAYLTEIKSRIATVTPYLDKYWPATGGNTTVPAAGNRPDFNEFPLFLSGNSHDRDVNDVDLWLMHTQEPPKGSDNRNDAALELRNFLESTKGSGNPVSYHYTGSMANDGGTTVVDCVDTDEASWSVGNSNDRSINFCFAGTRSDWTRQQWLDNERGTIEAAAYLFVQDCAKYPKLKARVLAPNYSAPPGAADHKYCTEYLKDGNDHTDVGPNFPWDVFTEAVGKYAAEPTGPISPAPQSGPVGPADDQLTLRFRILGGQTLVEAVAQVRDRVLGTNDRSKTGVL